jgi:hypothetical protein
MEYGPRRNMAAAMPEDAEGIETTHNWTAEDVGAAAAFGSVVHTDERLLAKYLKYKNVMKSLEIAKPIVPMQS